MAEAKGNEIVPSFTLLRRIRDQSLQIFRGCHFAIETRLEMVLRYCEPILRRAMNCGRLREEIVHKFEVSKRCGKPLPRAQWGRAGLFTQHQARRVSSLSKHGLIDAVYHDRCCRLMYRKYTKCVFGISQALFEHVWNRLSQAMLSRSADLPTQRRCYLQHMFKGMSRPWRSSRSRYDNFSSHELIKCRSPASR